MVQKQRGTRMILKILENIYQIHARTTGVSREKPPGGGVFILASLKSNQEKTPPQEIDYYGLKLNYAA